MLIWVSLHCNDRQQSSWEFGFEDLLLMLLGVYIYDIYIHELPEQMFHLSK